VTYCRLGVRSPAAGSWQLACLYRRDLGKLTLKRESQVETCSNIDERTPSRGKLIMGAERMAAKAAGVGVDQGRGGR